MQDAYEGLTAFKIKDRYCIGKDDKIKKDDLAALEAFLTTAKNAKGRAAKYKNWLTTFASKGAGKVGKLNELSPGAGTAIKDGSFFERYETLLADTEELKAIIEVLIGRATVNCDDADKGNVPSAVSPAAPSAPKAPKSKAVAKEVKKLLADIDLTAAYEEINIPALPQRFCSIEEKHALSREIFRLEKLAIRNHRTARKLRNRVFIKHDDYKHDRRRAIAARDAASAAGDKKAVATQTTMIDALDIALETLSATHKTALAAVERWAQVLDKVRADYYKLDDIPIIDCDGIGEKPANSNAIIDGINKARGAAPDFGGPSDSRFGMPDFGKLERDRMINGGAGFDGSEAEAAVEEAVNNVDLAPRVYIVETPGDPFAASPQRMMVNKNPATPTPSPAPANKTQSTQQSETAKAASFRPIDLRTAPVANVTVTKPAPQTGTTVATGAVPDKKPLVFNGTFAPQPQGALTPVAAPPLVVLDYLGNPVGQAAPADPNTAAVPQPGK